MSVIPVNLDDIEEQKPAAGGTYSLQIVKCDVTKTGPNSKQPGSPQYKVSIGFQDSPDTPNITHYVSLPNGEEDDGGKFKALLLKRFLVLFNIPYGNEIDTDRLAMEMVGAEATADVQQTEPDDSGNVYNRLVIPRLRNEEQSGRAKPPRR